MRIPCYYPSQLRLLFFQFSIFSVIYARVVNDNTPIPRFLPTPSNLTVRAGEVAEIKCQIQNLEGRTVVWRRASEPNPLSIGTTPYTEKHRVRVEHTGQMWKLYLANVQPRDSGVYECQISSKENLKKLFMLRVNGTATDTGFFPKAIQVQGTEVVEIGQPIKLECNTSLMANSPQDLDWFLKGDKIKPNFNRQITIQNERSPKSGVYTSRLEIKHSQKSDTGMYLCRDSNKEVARIYVNVLNNLPSAQITVKPTIQVQGTEVVEIGQPIKLECNTSLMANSPQDLDWFLKGDKIKPNFNRQITIQNERSPKSGVYTSRLEIKHSQKSDTGMYLCRDSNEEVARIYVNVLNTYSSNVKRGGSMTEGSGGASSVSGTAPCPKIVFVSGILANIIGLSLTYRTLY